MGFLPYIIAGIVFIGAAAGFYGKIHHDGYVEGKGEVKQAWDAANVEAQKKIDAERAKEVALRESQAKEATKRLADEKKRNVILMASLEAHIKASGVAVQCPLPPSLLDFTLAFYISVVVDFSIESCRNPDKDYPCDDKSRKTNRKHVVHLPVDIRLQCVKPQKENKPAQEGPKNHR